LRHQSNLQEGLESQDLARLVHDELHIDEYKSKMGNDEDIVVLSFKVHGKEPAVDLVNFIEKGFDWVLDADTSAGEMEDGDYVVFVELERNNDIVKNLLDLLTDLVPLTDNHVKSWRIKYHKNNKEYRADPEDLKHVIPSSPAEYLRAIGSKEEVNQLKSAAGLDVNTKAPKNEYTESLRIAAGIL